MRFRRFMPTPSMAVALTALFVALGGSGYAASQLQQSSGSAIAAKKTQTRGGLPYEHQGPLFQPARGSRRRDTVVSRRP